MLKTVQIIINMKDVNLSCKYMEHINQYYVKRNIVNKNKNYTLYASIWPYRTNNANTIRFLPFRTTSSL